jgi:23S rRNA pseudouridine2605 synthase
VEDLGNTRFAPLTKEMVNLPRALSKLGFCSRSQAEVLREGKVRINGQIVRLLNRRLHLSRDEIPVDNAEAATGDFIYLMLNKPRGLVTTASDERARTTVYQFLAGAKLPRVIPVGRLARRAKACCCSPTTQNGRTRSRFPRRIFERFIMCS